MTDYLPIPRFPLPDNWTVEGTRCILVRIPDDDQYQSAIIGLIDALKWSKNFARDATATGAAVVSRTWQSALEAYPIEAKDCDMVAFRINPLTCLLEVDCSGEGTDWQPVFTPAYEPNTDAPMPETLYPDPPPPGQDNACLAAANLTAMLQNGANNISILMDEGGGPGETLGFIFTFLSAVVTIVQAQLWPDFVVAFSTWNAATIRADYLAFNWDELKNLLVCYFDEDGQWAGDLITEQITSFNDALNEVQGNIPDSQIWGVISFAMAAMGWIGTNLATRWAGIEDADCADCGQWVRYYRTTHSDWPQWVNGQPGTGYEIEGEYVAGSGWSISEYQSGGSSYTRMIVLHLSVAGMNLERIIVKAQGVTSTPSNGPLGFVIYDLQHSSYWYAELAPDNTTFDIEMDATGGTESIMIQVGLDVEASFAALAGSGFVYDIELRGTGTAPTGGV